MPTSPTPNGRGRHVPASPTNDPTPCALDFAQLLHARQELEQHAQTYLADLQAQIRMALERRGYQDVRLRPGEGAPPPADAAGAVTLTLLARLPLDGLKSPVFRVQLPLAVTYAGQLLVQGAQINAFTVPEPYVQSLTVDRVHVAEALVQGLSQRYMDHLLQVGGTRPAVVFKADPRRQYITDWE